MSLFDEQIKKVHAFLHCKERTKPVQRFLKENVEAWPVGSSLILEEDTAIELGNPSLGSVLLLMWTKKALIEKNRISIVGEDIQSIGIKSGPFAQIILVQGDFEENLDAYRSLMDAMYDTELQGFMTRTMPSRQTIWCRTNLQAMQEGFSLAHLGAALIEKIQKEPFVKGVEVIFITSNKNDILTLQDVALHAERIIGAMLKLNQEIAHECESCVFWDVCASVEEFKKQRKLILEQQKK